MERRGVPAVMVATSSFVDLSRTVASTLGLASARCAVVPHPLGDLDSAAVVALAAGAADAVAALFTSGGGS